MKARQIGNISFTEVSYDKFTKLPKEEQIDKVYNSLNPKDRRQAEKLLAHIPNGNIVSGNEQEVQEDNGTDATGGSGGDNPDTSAGGKANKRGGTSTR